MSTEVWTALGGAVGLLASFIAARVERVGRNKWFVGAAVALCLIFIGGMFSSAAKSSDPFKMIFVLFYTVILAFCWAFFYAHTVGNVAVKIVRSLISLDDIRIPPPFSLVEAAISKRDYAGALTLLKKVVADYPAEPEPQRRLGELHLIMERPVDAIAAFREAERLDPDVRQKLLYTFSISEVLAEKQHNAEAALGEIERFLAIHPDVPGREFADERIERLRRKLAAGGRP